MKLGRESHGGCPYALGNAMWVTGCNRAVQKMSSPWAIGRFLVTPSAAASAKVNQQEHGASMPKPLEEKAP